MSTSTPQILPLPLLFLTLPQLFSRISSRPVSPLSRTDANAINYPKPTIAFLTPTIHGHSNIALTIIRRLQSTYTECNVHVFGDKSLGKRFTQNPEIFHSIGETDMLQACAARATSNTTAENFRSPPISLRRKGALSVIAGLGHIIAPAPEEYLGRYQKMLQFIQELKPDLLVVDVLYGPMGLDLSITTGVPYVLLSPTASLDVAFFHQPRWEAFWKLPTFFTSTTYPVPLLQIPANLILGLLIVLICIVHPARRKLDAARHQIGLTRSILNPPVYHAVALICPSLPELEYPHVPCPRTAFIGPIIRPERPVSKADYPNLGAFLDGGPTVLINLGTLFHYARLDVEAIVDALITTSSRIGAFRVLWKLPKKGEFADILGRLELNFHDSNGGLIRVEEWLEPPSLAILEHPNLMVSVHHGGANSVYEATYAGVPQVILAMWYDLYTLASRVETLGHGIFANRGFETSIDTTRLTDALVCLLLVDDARGLSMQARARELAESCKKFRGDERAADIIWRAATGQSLAFCTTQ